MPQRCVKLVRVTHPMTECGMVLVTGFHGCTHLCFDLGEVQMQIQQEDLWV